MNAYKFYGEHATFTKNFESDAEMWMYAEGMTDSARMVPVQKFIGGDWFDWDMDRERWVYNAKVIKGTVLK